MQVGLKGGHRLSGWLTWRIVQRWRCFSLGHSAKAPSQWRAGIASPRTVDWMDPSPSVPAIEVSWNNTHDTVKVKGRSCCSTTSLVRRRFEVTNWFKDTWKQNILCGKPQSFSRTLTVWFYFFGFCLFLQPRQVTQNTFHRVIANMHLHSYAQVQPVQTCTPSCASRLLGRSSTTRCEHVVIMKYHTNQGRGSCIEKLLKKQMLRKRLHHKSDFFQW